MSTEIKEQTVKIRFSKKIYKKHPWYIPILKERDGVFKTGQDLSYDKMVGRTPLTEEERAKYPIVIDPTEYYKIFDGQKFNLLDPTDKLMVELAINSGEIAATLSELNKNKIKYIGWVEDEISESKAYNDTEDKKYEAQTMIRNSPIDDYKRIALLVNYTMVKNIKIDDMPTEYVKAKLLEAANEDAEAMLQCFPKYNPGIQQDLYILELIKHKILTKKSNSEIYDGDVFVGGSLSRAKNFLTLKANAGSVDKWKQMLDQAKGKVSDTVLGSLDKLDRRTSDYKDSVNIIKVAYADKNKEKMEYYYDKITKEFGDLLDSATEDNILSMISELKNKRRDELNSHKKEQFIKQLGELSLDELQRKIRNAKTAYQEDACTSVLRDKEGLISYMAKVKFPE